MIVDIRFKYGVPQQIQGVRMITSYLDGPDPVLVMQLYKYEAGPIHIDMGIIKEIQVTND